MDLCACILRLMEGIEDQPSLECKDELLYWAFVYIFFKISVASVCIFFKRIVALSFCLPIDCHFTANGMVSFRPFPERFTECSCPSFIVLLIGCYPAPWWTTTGHRALKHPLFASQLLNAKTQLPHFLFKKICYNRAKFTSACNLTVYFRCWCQNNPHITVYFVQSFLACN